MVIPCFLRGEKGHSSNASRWSRETELPLISRHHFFHVHQIYDIFLFFASPKYIFLKKNIFSSAKMSAPWIVLCLRKGCGHLYWLFFSQTFLIRTPEFWSHWFYVQNRATLVMQLVGALNSNQEGESGLANAVQISQVELPGVLKANQAMPTMASSKLMGAVQPF